VVELAPGDPHDAPSRCRERAVAGAVGLEGAAGGVDGVAVELGDEAVVGPGGVDAWCGAVCERDARVRARAREAVGVEEGEERRSG
jgi:hypothetical protein